jgi:hypothetical protein
MNHTKETYRASVEFNLNVIKLEPVKELELQENEMQGLLEEVKNALKNYGCQPDPNDHDGPHDHAKYYLSGEKSINWKLEDISRGSCCDGSQPQIVCEIDLTTNVTKCWAECPDSKDSSMKIKFGPGSKGVSY